MKGENGLFMNKRKIVYIAILSVAAIFVLSSFVGYTINLVNNKVMQSCFDELGETSRQLASEFKRTVEMDRMILKSIGGLISSGGDLNDESLCKTMEACSLTTAYVSHLMLLRPDGTMLASDGTVYNVKEALDFAVEAQKGEYVSNIKDSVINIGEKVVLNSVPVIKNGETIYILYGVVLLSELPDRYKTSIYEGKAFVYVEDGDTGDFIMDTWHRTLGSIIKLGQRETLPGYSVDDAILDMHNGVGGEMGFVSRTTGGILYMRYDPIGVNNWNIMITVEQEYALKRSSAISSSLYTMAAVIGITLLIYIYCVYRFLYGAYRQVQRVATIDQNTGLQNRNAYDKFVEDCQKKTFSSISCVYIDVNGLHDINNQFGHYAGDQMLRSISDVLKSKFKFEYIYRVGGDEFIVFDIDDEFSACREKMRGVIEEIESKGYHIAYGVVTRENETGVDGIIRDADEKMLNDKRAFYAASGRNLR